MKQLLAHFIIYSKNTFAMFKKILFTLPLLFLFTACKNDDGNQLTNCSLVDCLVGVDIIYLLFLNADSEEDLLANGAIDPNLISIINEESDQVTFTIEEFSGMGIYLAIPVATNSYGQKHFTIDFNEGESFTINFETSFSEGGECCGPYTILEQYAIDNYSYELMESSPLPAFSTVYIPNLN
ncbi:hypothetical protein [Flagellimonas zhangzhouensis]|nr:hypothetical protein [Allomuricauda zhangzhouensis]